MKKPEKKMRSLIPKEKVWSLGRFGVAGDDWTWEVVFSDDLVPDG